MPVNWDELHEGIDAAIENAGGRTDAKLAGVLSGVTRLTDDEIRRLFPVPADVKRVAELMEIVKKAGERNEKINEITSNIENYGGVILTLLTKLA